MRIQFLTGDVEFRNVSFGYAVETDGYTIDDISFHVKPGETAAFRRGNRGREDDDHAVACPLL